MHPSIPLRLFAAAALMVVARSEAGTPTDVATPPDVADRQLAAQAPDLATLAQTIPGFGGFYLEDGVPTVYLTDVGRRDAAEAALAGYAGAHGLAASQIRILEGDYDYQQLDHWFQRVSYEAFEIAGVVFVDLDEAANRVAVGVEHAAAEASVRGLAARLGLPAGALVVREVEPIHPVITLRDAIVPRVGGIQIHFGHYLCTLGFNALHALGDSFITNSHCSKRQGRTDGTVYYQPTSSEDPDPIGTEVDDPPFFRGDPCPRGRKCRYSDALRAAYASGISYTLGGIAKTSGPNDGSVEIAGTFTIGSEGTAAVGATVNKVGRTTGWTQGLVTNTCVNTAVLGSNIVQLCQTFVSAGVGAGDSGSPVFSGTSTVTLLGILWGGNSSGKEFVYSPMSGIEQELGLLTTSPPP